MSTWKCVECSLTNDSKSGQCQACFSNNVTFDPLNAMADEEKTDGMRLEELPPVITDHIWDYLIAEPPFADSLVAVSRFFRDTTYKHHSFPIRFHVRIDPRFQFRNHPKQLFQMGDGHITPATGRSIIIRDIQPIIHSCFPFPNMRVWHICQESTFDMIAPIFQKVAPSMRMMLWNNPQFIAERVVNAKLPSFENCFTFSLLLRKRWRNECLTLAKFPNLVFFAVTIEDMCHIDLLQTYFANERTQQSLRILTLDFSIYHSDDSREYTLQLPQHLEIVRIQFLRDVELTIDWSLCKHNLKQIVIGRKSWRHIAPLFADAKSLPTGLKCLVFDDRDSMYNLPWDNLSTILNENRMRHLYAPCYQSYASKISEMCVGTFPTIDDVKPHIDSKEARVILRDLYCKERRHWLWGLFWSDYRHGHMESFPD